MQVFVANPNKPREIIQVLVENHREVLKLLHNLPTSKGTTAVLYTYNLTLALFCDQTIDASNRVTRYHGWNSMLRFLSDAHWSANNVSHFTGEDEQLDEERDLIIKEIEKLVRLSV
jgi:hypothetical protein